MAIPSMALKEVIFWIVMLFILGTLTGAATKIGGIIVGKVWPKMEEKKDRRNEPNWLHELIVMHKGFMQSNHEVVEELRRFSSAIEGGTVRVIEAIGELDVPRKVKVR